MPKNNFSTERQVIQISRPLPLSPEKKEARAKRLLVDHFLHQRPHTRARAGLREQDLDDDKTWTR